MFHMCEGQYVLLSVVENVNLHSLELFSKAAWGIRNNKLMMACSLQLS